MNILTVGTVPGYRRHLRGRWLYQGRRSSNIPSCKSRSSFLLLYKKLKSSLSSLPSPPLVSLLPVLLVALILRTFPGCPSEIKTFPRTALRVSELGSLMVEYLPSSSWVLVILVFYSKHSAEIESEDKEILTCRTEPSELTYKFGIISAFLLRKGQGPAPAPMTSPELSEPVRRG